jgi:hypothetical protein
MMPKTFNLKIRDKGFFPYLFNKPENLDRQLTELPSEDEYAPRGMIKSQRKEFEEWYSANKQNSFHLAEELAAYCTNDTQILLHAVVAMQKIFKSITKLDIFKSKTIASAVMKHFQLNHLPNSQHLALISERAYGLDRQFKQSTLARKYLKWFAIEWDVPIRTSETYDHETKEFGEKKIGKYYLDGYVHRSIRKDGNNEQDLGIEVHGCFYHACPVHFPNDDQIMIDGTTAANVRRHNKEREVQIKEDAPELELRIVWECEV